ncbi:MAG: restriction endonuclease [Methanosarcinales archaeon]|nr:restriction endonuclease [Methanosarcinales archaeon]
MQGYYTYRSPEDPDGGVDILAGRVPMGFGEARLCVQVKSGVFKMIYLFGNLMV